MIGADGRWTLATLPLAAPLLTAPLLTALLLAACADPTTTASADDDGGAPDSADGAPGGAGGDAASDAGVDAGELDSRTQSDSGQTIDTVNRSADAGANDSGNVDSGIVDVGCKVDSDCSAQLGDVPMCRTAACDLSIGCTLIAVTDGTPCDDGDACTVKTACVAGACDSSTKANCDDANACTDDACSPTTGCQHTSNTQACDDDDPCSSGDTCSDGQCAAGTTQVCKCTSDTDCNDQGTTDKCAATLYCDKAAAPYACKIKTPKIVCATASDPCQANVCNGATGSCGAVAGPDDKPCDDNDACTAGDSCKNGACKGAATQPCADAGPCSSAKCDPDKGCVNVDKSGSCDDGDACSTGDNCKDGACAATGKLDCDDKQPCTLDACKKATGCTHDGSALNGTGCDDGSVCTQTDTCQAGVCVGGAPKTCDDSDKCTKDTCDKLTGCASSPIAGCVDCGTKLQCKGAGLPGWKLQDLNPTSPTANQTYSPQAYKGTPVVLFFLHGY